MRVWINARRVFFVVCLKRTKCCIINIYFVTYLVVFFILKVFQILEKKLFKNCEYLWQDFPQELAQVQEYYNPFDFGFVSYKKYIYYNNMCMKNEYMGREKKWQQKSVVGCVRAYVRACVCVWIY